MLRMKELPWILAVSVFAATAPLLAEGSLTDKVELHAFGGWAAGASSPNPYLTGRGSGVEADNVAVDLLFILRPISEIRIDVQPSFTSVESGTATVLDIASIHYELSPKLAVTFGRSRMPFGNYTDIFAVGTARPFYHLPQSIYGPSSFVSNHYDGVGVIGKQALGAWDVNYEAWAGEIDLELDKPWEIAAGVTTDPELLAGQKHIRDMVGGRLTLQTPIERLNFGVSGFAGKPSLSAKGATKWGDFYSGGLHAELLREAWEVRGEIGHHVSSDFTTDAFYFEAGFRLSSRWQLAARYDQGNNHLTGALPLPAGAKSLLFHRESSIGINRWFGNNLVMKLSYHHVDGNLFAHDNSRLPTFATNPLDKQTGLVQFGVQFAF